MQEAVVNVNFFNRRYYIGFKVNIRGLFIDLEAQVIQWQRRRADFNLQMARYIILNKNIHGGMHFSLVKIRLLIILFYQSSFKIVCKNCTDHLDLIILLVILDIS